MLSARFSTTPQLKGEGRPELFIMFRKVDKSWTVTIRLPDKVNASANEIV